MQAQVEPHFLFNTLASVQYLTETDPPQANVLLGHLIGYLRAALPQLRAGSSTLGQEASLPRPISTSCRCAWASASHSRSTFPHELRDAAVSAEPADLAGRERDQARHRAAGRKAAGSTSRAAAHAGDRSW